MQKVKSIKASGGKPPVDGMNFPVTFRYPGIIKRTRKRHENKDLIWSYKWFTLDAT